MKIVNSGRWLVGTVAMLILVPFLASCGASDDDDFVDWDGEAPTASADSASATAADAAGSASPPASQPPVAHSAEFLRDVQPNEIGLVPVMEYHVISTDPAAEVDPFVRTADHMREDLQFLYDQDFYVISVRDFLTNTISAPAGKHPVVMTLDDATTSQFRWIDGPHGDRVLDPDSGLGVLEQFYADHPDFGKGGMFAILPYNCFADGTKYNTMDTCDEKLNWLANNGYEVSNHTMDHTDMLDVSDDTFKETVGGMVEWLNARVDGPGLLSEALVMPYGNYPSASLHPEQRFMMREGFTYNGTDVTILGAFLVGANPTESPSSATFDPIFVARIQAFDESLDEWFPQFEHHTISLYTSDGDPDVIVVPSVLPGDLEGQYDPDLILESGKNLVEYDPETGDVTRQHREKRSGWINAPRDGFWKDRRWQMGGFDRCAVETLPEGAA